jgi:outer membrane immunogenic protein
MKYRSFFSLGLILATTALSGGAYAQDTWSGLYIGASGAYAALNAEHTEGGNSEPDVNVDGALFGIQGGYNLRLDQIVLGVEGSFALSDADGSGHFYSNNNCCDYDINMKNLGTVRARAGMALGESENTLLYITGGLAFADLKISGYPDSASESHTGFVIGLGAEHMVTDSISIKAEYNPGEVIKLAGSVFEVGVNFHF